MLDAVVGALIMVVATSALVLAVEVAEQVSRSAGRQPLSANEIELLRRAKRNDSNSLNILQADLEAFPRE